LEKRQSVVHLIDELKPQGARPITESSVMAKMRARVQEKSRPEIEKEDRLRARSLAISKTKIVC
jgi:hypothetical protein